MWLKKDLQMVISDHEKLVYPWTGPKPNSMRPDLLLPILYKGVSVKRLKKLVDHFGYFDKLIFYLKTAMATFGKIWLLFTSTSGHTACELNTAQASSYAMEQ